jgi:hypothetical protein
LLLGGECAGGDGVVADVLARTGGGGCVQGPAVEEFGRGEGERRAERGDNGGKGTKTIENALGGSVKDRKKKSEFFQQVAGSTQVGT